MFGPELSESNLSVWVLNLACLIGGGKRQLNISLNGVLSGPLSYINISPANELTDILMLSTILFQAEAMGEWIGYASDILNDTSLNSLYDDVNIYIFLTKIFLLLCIN